MNYQLKDLTQVVRSWGRGVVFRNSVWDPTGALSLSHLMDTEGDLVVQTNPETAKLTTPELTGPAAHEMDYTGEDPVIEIPGYLTDPSLWAVCSPGGSAHAGNERRGTVAEHTIVIFPELLWEDPSTGRIDRTKNLAFSGGVWTFDAAPLSVAKLALLDATFWLWRAAFTRPPRTFHGGAGDARKNIETISAQGLFHPGMPDGHHLYTTGDPADSGINLEGSS